MAYPEIAQLIYSVALLGVMGFGILRATMDPTVVRGLRDSPSATLWLITSALVGVAVVLTAVSYLLAGESSLRILGPMMLGMTVMMVIALGAWPIMAQGDRFERRPLTLRVVEFPLFLVLTLAWSFLSLHLVQKSVELEVSSDFLLAEIVERPWVEFATLTVIVVIMAMLEEFVFRGAIQGWLERTRLGVAGAIIVASLIWAVGHVGYLEPHGVKEMQILGLGILFGIAKARHGLRWAVALHVANNLGAMVLTGLERG